MLMRPSKPAEYTNIAKICGNAKINAKFLSVDVMLGS